MDIYEKDGAEGVIDLTKARTQLAATSGINSDAERKKIVAEITAGALLDIAASLRPLAAEVRDAQAGQTSYPDAVTVPAEQGEPAWMLLDVGDYVEPATDEQPERVGRIVELAIREDEPSARVQWYDRATGKPVAEGWSFLAALFPADPPTSTPAPKVAEPESTGSQIMDGVPLTVETDDERRIRVNREREERIAAEKANPTPEPEPVPAAAQPDPMFSIGADDDASPAAEMRAGNRAVDIDADFDAADPLTVLKAKTKKSGKAKKKEKK